MSFFQNVFETEFRGSLMSGDRRLASNFKIGPNSNGSNYMLSSVAGPFDLTANTDLTINFAYDPLLLGYASISVNISGVTVSETTPLDVVTALNGDAIFADLFVASSVNGKILIKSKGNKPNFRAYISNGGAESVLKFNAKAPVVELPQYFERYAFENRFDYQRLGPHRLVLLDETDATDAAIITAAGFDPLSPTPDWELLAGGNDAFFFTKRTYSGGKLATEIVYPAGAREGDLAKKTFYTYSGSDLIETMETPYVLTSGDLVTPP